MKNALILLADGFEETEALTTHDVLRRSHLVNPVLASITPDLTVRTSAGNKILAEDILERIDPSNYSFMVLPGGKEGVENLGKSLMVTHFINLFVKEGKPIYAICAAPSILARRGYYDGKKYTCFPGFEYGNGTYIDEGVVNDNGTITGRSMGYTIPFAKEILKQEFGEQLASCVNTGIFGLR